MSDLIPKTNQALTQVEAIKQVLSQTTPRAAIRYRPGKGGKMQAYVDHAYVTETLNKAFGWDWDFEIDHEQIHYIGKDNNLPFEATCRGKLTVRLNGQAIVKMQMGSHPIEMQKNSPVPVSIGDVLKAAASDALKKCASLLGVALDLYDSDSPTHQAVRGWACSEETANSVLVVCEQATQRGATVDDLRALLPDGLQSRQQLTEAQGHVFIERVKGWTK